MNGYKTFFLFIFHLLVSLLGLIGLEGHLIFYHSHTSRTSPKNIKIHK